MVMARLHGTTFYGKKIEVEANGFAFYVTEITMWEILNFNDADYLLIESLEYVIKARGLSNLRNFRVMKT